MSFLCTLSPLYSGYIQDPEGHGVTVQGKVCVGIGKYRGTHKTLGAMGGSWALHTYLALYSDLHDPLYPRGLYVPLYSLHTYLALYSDLHDPLYPRDLYVLLYPYTHTLPCIVISMTLCTPGVCMYPCTPTHIPCPV